MKSRGEPSRLRELLDQADAKDVDLKRALWALAYEVHRDGGASDDDGAGLADIADHRLVRVLARLHPDESADWAREVVEVIRSRAGLLIERETEVFTFPHRTFQEYLAGAHLASQPDFATACVAVFDAGAFWRTAILLGVGRLTYVNGEVERPLALVAELCPEAPADNAAGWRRRWLAGEVLDELGTARARRIGLGRDLLARVPRRLVDLLHGGELPPVERAAAGVTLAHLGDPRFRADAWFLPDDPLLGFVEVPVGPFRMGSDKRRDPRAHERELPRHEVTVPGYYLARFPVTVAQFRAYVEDSDRQSVHSASLRGPSNHPVVNVTWHEAVAYCRWLTGKLAVWDGTPDAIGRPVRGEGVEHSWQVTLPSEAMWEKSARGADGRRYPWGNDHDPNRANYADTGVGGTSTVGSFPGGASPFGAEELIGNVYEWVSDDWHFGYEGGPIDGSAWVNKPRANRRVVRGGAFDDTESYVRGAYRLGLKSDVRLYYLGFRVVVSPFFSDL